MRLGAFRGRFLWGLLACRMFGLWLPATHPTVAVTGGAGFWQLQLVCAVHTVHMEGSGQRGVEAGLCFAGPCQFWVAVFAHCIYTACVFCGVRR